MSTLQINGDLTLSNYTRNPLRKKTIKSNDLLQEIEVDFSKPTGNNEQKAQELTFLEYQFVWKLMPSIPIGRAINTARHRLAEAGISTASYEAYTILAYVLQRERNWVFTNYEYELDNQQASLYTELIVRRCNNEPLNALFNH